MSRKLPPGLRLRCASALHSLRRGRPGWDDGVLVVRRDLPDGEASTGHPYKCGACGEADAVIKA